MTTPKTPARLDAEARKARMRYQNRGAFAGSSEAAQQACWEEAVRPLVEEIERLRGEPQAHDLTPSEVALARILAAYLECQAVWKDRPDKDRGAPILDMLHVEDTLRRIGIVDDTIPSARGRALLDRARKAGVL